MNKEVYPIHLILLYFRGTILNTNPEIRMCMIINLMYDEVLRQKQMQWTWILFTLHNKIFDRFKYLNVFTKTIPTFFSSSF